MEDYTKRESVDSKDVVPYVLANYERATEYGIADAERQLIATNPLSTDKGLLYALRISLCLPQIKKLDTLASRYNTAENRGLLTSKESPYYQKVYDFLTDKYLCRFVELADEVYQKAKETAGKQISKEAKVKVLYAAQEKIFNSMQLFEHVFVSLEGATDSFLKQISEDVANIGTLGSTSINISQSPFDDAISSLHKEATQLKKAGDLNAAIEKLRTVNEKMRKSTIIYTMEQYLRLSLFLQKAGRSDEAWDEFNKLLNDPPTLPSGITGSSKSVLLTIDQYIIYDKMRLFLQREKKYLAAIDYGIRSFLTWQQSLVLQGRHDEVSKFEETKTAIIKLLEPANKLDALDHVLDIVTTAILALPDIDLAVIKEKMDNCLSR